MKNLKRILTLLVVLAMVFACVFALAACKEDPEGENPGGTNPGGTTGGGSGSGSGEGGGSSTPAEVPVEDGKVSIFWTSDYQLPSYVSIWFVGGVCTNGFDSKTPDAGILEGKKVADSNTYYVQVDKARLEAKPNQWNEYCLILGYNESTGQPDAKLGIGPGWVDARKSKECAAFAYPANASFEWDGTAGKIDLGNHTFDAQLSEPVTLNNVTVRATFKASAEIFNNNTVVYISGSFNGWNTDPNGVCKATKVTADIDASKVVAFDVKADDVFADDYECCVVVFPNGIGEPITGLKDDKGNPRDTTIWDYYGQVDDAIQVKYQGGNIPTPFGDGDSDKIVKACGEYFKGYEDTEVVDLSLAKDKVFELDTPVSTTFRITFKEALPADVHVFLCGSGVGSIDWNSASEMTASQDRKTFEFTVDNTFEGKVLTFKVVVGQPTTDKEGKPAWPDGVEINSSNATVEVVEGVTNLFEAAQEYKAPAAKPAE